MPDLMDFLLYSFYNSNFKAEHLGSKKSTARLCNAGIALLEYFRTGSQSKLEAFLNLLSGYEILELARTGIAGLTRGVDRVVYIDEEDNKSL